MRIKSYVVYMLLCSDGSFYVGATTDLGLRIGWHNEALDPFCYTYGRLPVQLVWSETFSDWNEALTRERQVKGWSRSKKMALVEGDWDEIQRLARLRNQGRKAESPR